MLARVFVSRSSRALLSGTRGLIARPRPSTGTRWWSVLSGFGATTRTVTQKPWVSSVCACSKVCACGAHKITQGDQDLLGFLSDEIKIEKDNTKDSPSSNSFQANVDGTVVNLQRELNGEKIVITFDVNENINEDEAYVSGDESDDEKLGSVDEPHSQTAGDIVSYPYFTVDIIKDSGKTLRFTCEYNQGVVKSAEGGEDDELFQVINVIVISSPDAVDAKGVYAAETENLDPNLYTLLLNMLAERGVNSDFAQWLLDYSTALEHQHYIKFLEDLEGFIKKN